MMPGSDSDGWNMVSDTAWQNLAKRHDFALLGCCYEDKMHDNMDIENYANVKNGSGRALIDICCNFSIEIKH